MIEFGNNNTWRKAYFYGVSKALIPMGGTQRLPFLGWGEGAATYTQTV